MNLTFSTRLSGLLNGEPILVIGKGTINEDLGITEGEYDLAKLPEGFPVEILTVMKVTGYPNASRAVGSAVNPFKGQSYKYTRDIRVSDGNMRLHSTVHVEAAELISNFEISGGFGAPGTLGKVRPIRERWGVRDNNVAGEFDASWLDLDGNEYTARTSTIYELKLPDILPIRQYRDIILDTHCSGSKFRLKQSVQLHAE